MKPDGKFILLVEDDPNDVFFFERALGKNGVPAERLRVVSDGEAAIAYLGGEGKFSNRSEYPLPDLIFLDINMPRKTGLEVLSWLREQSAFVSTPAVILTSSKHSSEIEEAYRLRANSYLVKPVRMDDLVGMLKIAVDYWLSFNWTPQSAL